MDDMIYARKGDNRMDVISAKEASEKWGIHIRMVQRYCIEGKIPGAEKHGNNWLIPLEAKKPTSSKNQHLEQSQAYDYPSCKVMTSIISLPDIGAQGPLLSGGDELQYRQSECEMAYVRGDFEFVKKLFTDAPEASPSKFYFSSVAIAAAISTGDYNFYTQVDTFLKTQISTQKNAEIANLAELFLATASVSMFAPEMAPKWLKDGEFSGIAVEQKPFALYLYGKYLQNIRQFSSMLAVAKTALTLCAPKSGFTLLDIYLRILCACASYALNQRDYARIYITEALELGMPYGFTNPFAENAAGFGGLLESLLEQKYPDACAVVQNQWQNTFQNWVSFHNRFAKKHVTDILTLQECHIAQLLANGATYAETARFMNISLGSLNNMVSVIYGKLFIQKKSELKAFLF